MTRAPLRGGKHQNGFCSSLIAHCSPLHALSLRAAQALPTFRSLCKGGLGRPEPSFPRGAFSFHGFQPFTMGAHELGAPHIPARLPLDCPALPVQMKGAMTEGAEGSPLFACARVSFPQKRARPALLPSTLVPENKLAQPCRSLPSGLRGEPLTGQSGLQVDARLSRFRPRKRRKGEEGLGERCFGPLFRACSRARKVSSLCSPGRRRRQRLYRGGFFNACVSAQEYRRAKR